MPVNSDKPKKLPRYSAILIAIIFLAYGLIRLGVGTALLGQELGMIDFVAFQQPLKEVGDFLSKMSHATLIPVSVAGYLSFIALMGATLSVGAIGSLQNKPFGIRFIGIFLVMYALLFITFQTISPKIIHLAVCLILFVLLISLKKDPKTVNSKTVF